MSCVQRVQKGSGYVLEYMPGAFGCDLRSSLSTLGKILRIGASPEQRESRCQSAGRSAYCAAFSLRYAQFQLFRQPLSVTMKTARRGGDEIIRQHGLSPNIEQRIMLAGGTDVGGEGGGGGTRVAPPPPHTCCPAING